jgi:hypothetical protein
MKMNMTSNIIDLSELREQTHVFQDRTHAGQVLARMLAADNEQSGIILAIPAGGVPVGLLMAESWGLILTWQSSARSPYPGILKPDTEPWRLTARFG